MVAPNAKRSRALAALIAVIAAVLPLGPAAAHNLAPQPLREMLRIQGYKAPAPPGAAVTRELTMIVLGQPVRFAATEWRVFAFFDSSAQTPPAEPAQVLVQGERPMLHNITAARPDQRITILAERRPGSSDLFVLAVDLCP